MSRIANIPYCQYHVLPISRITNVTIANIIYYQYNLLPMSLIANVTYCQYHILPIFYIANITFCQYHLLPISRIANTAYCQYHVCIANITYCQYLCIANITYYQYYCQYNYVANIHRCTCTPSSATLMAAKWANRSGMWLIRWMLSTASHWRRSTRNYLLGTWWVMRVAWALIGG